MNVKDASLKISRALPNGAANVTSATGIDTGVVTAGVGKQQGNIDFLLSAPALATGIMGDGKTMIYDIITSANSDMSAPTTLYPGLITQTGAASAGAAAATQRFRIPSDAKRYIGVKITGSATGDCTTATATVEALM